jgi:hypothetical protein
MNKRSDWSTLVLFLVITIGVFVLWIGAMLGLGFALHLAQVDSNFWAMTEALATAVAMSAVVGAGFIAYRQLNENTKSRHLDVADRLFTELNAPENVQARRWVFQNLPADPVQGLASLAREERDHVKKVLNSLDRVAFLTQPDWLPTDMMMPWMSPMVVKAWEKLQPYVDYESQRRHEPDYYRSVRELAARCLAWRQQNLGEAPIVWVPDAL